MPKLYFFLLLAWVLPFGSQAQTSTTLQGTVQTESGQLLPGATVFLKGTYVGSSTNENGKFILPLKQANFPEVLVVSFLGFRTEEVRVDQPMENLEITLRPSTLLTTLVVAASRKEESIGQAPVTINKLDQGQISQITTPDLIAGLGRLKNVDVLSSSMLTTSFSTRGFNAGLATRVLQLDDYMDTQLPSLNTYLGNTLGTPVLDIASVELVQGPASALYGAGAFNGVLLTNSRDPFQDQGLSVRLRGGSRNFFDGQLRYAQKLGKRVAFKIAGGATLAEDFVADNQDATSRAIDSYNNPANSGSGYNAVNRYGDFIVSNGIYFPGFSEQDLVADDNKTHSYKIAPTLSVLLSNSIKATLDYKYANMTTTFQSDGRYRYVNGGTQQARVQVQGSNWVVRAFSTSELSGKNSRIYNLGTLGDYLQEQPTLSFDPNTGDPLNYRQRYIYAIDEGLSLDPNPNGTREERLSFARAYANANAPQLQPGEADFVRLRKKVVQSPSPEGVAQKTRSTMREGSGQYNLNTRFADLIVGGAYRQYILDSDSTLFEDAQDGGTVRNYQYGAYGQASRALLRDRLKLSVAARVDNFKNFGTAFSPRAAVVYAAGVDKQHNFRFNFNRAYRSPTQTDQYIRNDTGNLLLLGNIRGGLQGYQTRLNDTVIARGSSMPDQLAPYAISLQRLKLEEVNGYEVGYRTQLSKKLYLDVNYYYNIYNDFITNQIFIGNPDGSVPTPNQVQFGAFVTGFTRNRATPGAPTRFIQTSVNVDQQVRSHGAGLEVSYVVSSAFTLLGNYSFSQLITKDFEAGTRSFYNTPRHKFNLGFNGQALNSNLSYNLNYRWTDSYLFESSFAIGTVPVAQNVDAQVGYTLPNLHTTLQVGATNLFNTTNIQMYGAPQYGRIGYFGLQFDIK